MKRLLIISHALVQEISQKRWRYLAENYPVEVFLLVPEIWETQWLGQKQIFKPKAFSQGRFHVIPLPTTDRQRWNRYLFKSFDVGLRSIKPDFIYVIHEEAIFVHHQIILYRNFWWPQAKMAFFSMNALGVPLHRFIRRLMWRHIKRHYSAALCHYPGCLRSLRDGGFEKPIFIQTQIGVDGEIYRPDARQRKQLRSELGMEKDFVIGYAGRLCKEKGVDDIIDALPLKNISWKLLLVGDGVLRDEILSKIKDKNWSDRVIMTGLIPQTQVASYLRVMDAFVIASKKTPQWIDTFPNAVAQAMACGVPVIGSKSGAIPYLLGDSGLLFSEGDARALRNHLMSLAGNDELREYLSQRGLERSSNLFEVKSLSSDFFQIMHRILSGRGGCNSSEIGGWCRRNE